MWSSRQGVRAEWVAAGIVSVAAAVASYFVYKKFCRKDRSCKNLVNLLIDKDNSKVVHMIDIEDILEQQAYCRCWRSEKFPICDGSHVKHNDDTGDNVGPLVIRRKVILT